MNADKLATWLFRVVLIYCVVLALDSSRACAAEEATATDAATTPTDKPAAPMSEPAAWRNKLTLSYYYFSSGNKGVDLNLRHSFESSTGWIGAYRETDGFDQLRTGWEYDLRREWFTIIPSVQAATHGFLGASPRANTIRF